MNPAYSVIFFTVFSGAGYGLLGLLGLVGMAHGQASSPAFGLTSAAVALVLVSAGLLSSTAHLGRPERAWRAVSQWRSSWLSREGVAAIATYPAALAFAAVWSGLIALPQWTWPLGLLTGLMCVLTVVCTGMIYQSLRTIPAWHSPLTVPGYLAFAVATGSGLLNGLSVIFGRFQAGAGLFMAILTAAAIAVVIGLKWLAWRRLEQSAGQFTMAQATGLGPGVRQWEVPHTASNFIMKEMGYVVARSHGLRLQRLCLLLLLVALAAACLSPMLPWLAFIAAPLLLAAAWIERWLFFAQARHVAGLYYGAGSV